jgi:hypothetical protein
MPPVTFEVQVPLSMLFKELLDQLRRDQFAFLSEQMLAVSHVYSPPPNADDEDHPELPPHLRSYWTMYTEGCVTLALAPVDEATHGALFRARTNSSTLAELRVDTLRGRLGLEPVILPIVKACPLLPREGGAFANAVLAAQTMAALKCSKRRTKKVSWTLSVPCQHWLAERLEMSLVSESVKDEGELQATLCVASWGRLARTREGFMRYPKEVREQLFTLLLLRQRGLFGVMDRNVCYLIGTYVVSLPQPVL